MPFIISHSLFVLTFWPLSFSHRTFLAFKLSVFSRRTLLCLQAQHVFPYFLEWVTQYGSWTLQGLTEILPSLKTLFDFQAKPESSFTLASWLLPISGVVLMTVSWNPLLFVFPSPVYELVGQQLWPVDLCIPSAWLSVVNVCAAVLKVWSLDQ